MPQLAHYRAILADPPWRFATYSAMGKGRSAERHYDCMSLPQMAQLPVRDWAAPDCALFLWTTNPMLPFALNLITAWNFTYKTIAFVWAKTNLDGSKWPIGTGYWTRANPEICLLGTRGNPKRLSRSVRELIIAPRREHSRKPDETYDRIESLCTGPYLELFARFPRSGWDSHGNEQGISQPRWRSNADGVYKTVDSPLESFL